MMQYIGNNPYNFTSRGVRYNLKVTKKQDSFNNEFKTVDTTGTSKKDTISYYRTNR